MSNTTYPPPESSVVIPNNQTAGPKRIFFFVGLGIGLFLILSVVSFLLIKNFTGKGQVPSYPTNLSPNYDQDVQQRETFKASTPEPTVALPQGSGQGGVPGQGIPLVGSTVKLIGVSISMRNLAGMLVQVNQIDLCSGETLTSYATVTDKDGKVFSDVRNSDFTVTVDGQKVETFDFAFVKDQNIPLSTILVLDHSGSMKGEPMTKAKEAAIDYVNRLKASDQVGLVQFDTQIDLLQNLTIDKEVVKNQINAITPRSDTALYDVIYFTAENTPSCGRKAIVLLTDGRDTASKKYTLEKAIEKANLQNVPVFVVGLKSEQFTPQILQKIAEGTGAQYFEAPNPQDLLALYQKINDQLRGQYQFIFKLTIPKTGNEHRLKISSQVTGSETTSEKSFIY